MQEDINFYSSHIATSQNLWLAQNRTIKNQEGNQKDSQIVRRGSLKIG